MRVGRDTVGRWFQCRGDLDLRGIRLGALVCGAGHRARRCECSVASASLGVGIGLPREGPAKIIEMTCGLLT